MRGQIQSFALSERITVSPCGWDLREYGRWAWLGRFLWRILRKLNLIEWQMKDEIQIVRLPSPPDLFSAIWTQIYGLEDCRRKPKEILVGPETLSRMVSSPELAQCRHRIEAKGEGYYNGFPFPVPVRLVPQMEGVLVID